MGEYERGFIDALQYVIILIEEEGLENLKNKLWEMLKILQKEKINKILNSLT